MATGAVEIVLGDFEQEKSQLRAIVTQSIQSQASLFVGRFLSDLPLPDGVRSQWATSKVVLRQYGCSLYVNAPPLLADARRAEIGLEEAETALCGGRFDRVLLSQFLTAVDEGLLTAADVLELVDARPRHVALILTGCTAPPALRLRCAGDLEASRVDFLSRSRR